MRCGVSDSLIQKIENKLEVSNRPSQTPQRSLDTLRVNTTFGAGYQRVFVTCWPLLRSTRPYILGLSIDSKRFAGEFNCS
jgi:hypothetical protein